MARVLVASDDLARMEFMASVLSGEGHEVFSASDGQEAYDLATSTLPHMVFLGTAMPVLDGFEVCQLMRNDSDFSPRLPIFLLTTVETNSRRVEKAGATGCLSNECSAVDLRDLLAEHLGPEAFLE